MSELGTYLLGMLLRGCLLALLLITVERHFQVRPGRKQLLVLLCLSFLPLSQPVLRLPSEIQLRTMQTVREERPAAPSSQTGSASSVPAPVSLHHAMGRTALFLIAAGLFLLLKRLHRLRRWTRRVRSLPPICDARMAALLNRARNLTGNTRRRIDLRDGGSLNAGPLSCCVFRSVILLPAERCGLLPDRELLMLLTHECLHLKRRDPLRTLLLTLTGTLFWFNPLIRLCRSRLEQLREMECDAQTAELLNLTSAGRGSYARLILDFAADGNVFPPLPACSLSRSAENIRQRIQGITMNSPASSRRLRCIMLCVLFSAGIAGCCLTPGVMKPEPAGKRRSFPRETTFTTSPYPASGLLLRCKAVRHESDFILFHFDLKEKGKTIAAPRIAVPDGDKGAVEMVTDFLPRETFRREFPSKNFGIGALDGFGAVILCRGKFLDDDHAEVKCSVFLRSGGRFDEKKKEFQEKTLVREYAIPRLKLGETVTFSLDRPNPYEVAAAE